VRVRVRVRYKVRVCDIRQFKYVIGQTSIRASVLDPIVVRGKLVG